MHPRPWFRLPASRRSRSGRSGRLTSAVTAVTALAVVAGLAAQPSWSRPNAGPASDSEPWYQDTAAEQLRQDQCLMADVLRLGGPSMAATAQDGLNQPADKLHVLANREHWDQTPLSTAYQKDRDAASKEMDDLDALRDGWKKPLNGLSTPGGFTDNGFHWPPDGEQSFYYQTGLSKWVADRFWLNDNDFYNDDTPKADDKTLKAVDDIGKPLYGKEPGGGTTQQEYEEHNAFEWMHGGPARNAGADDARIFLSSGGFPRTAPQPGTAEYRIAVEDVKSRFAACGWRDPLDPDNVLGDITATATNEWQQEISSQATQRNQILGANRSAVDALAKAAKALSGMLGHSWVADHLTRWQDYWSPGGIGWIGDSALVMRVEAAKGKCLDVQGGKKDNGTPVQIYTCNDSAAQEWKLGGLYDGGYALYNTNSQKCLDVKSGNNANGSKIQLWACNGSSAQQWQFDVRSAGELRNAATDKCLDLHTFDNGNDAQLYTCNGTDAQKIRIVPQGHDGDDKLDYPNKAQFDQAKAGIAGAQAGAKSQLAVLKQQLAVAQTAATNSDTALQAAYGIADAGGAPRGRGLLVGQQKAQVTRGAVAAVQAMEKAGETAEAATRASAGDSATIAQRALAQAAQAKAEFRKEAAKAAEEQAKAAADAAKVHRDNAKKDKETAEARLADAVKAEGDAKAAAADAHAKRLAAEAEEKTAKAEKETAAAKQAEAAQDRKNAEDQAGKAKDAKDRADAAEKTAGDKRDAAVKASDHARAMRDDAWDAEQKADAARAKADAKDAYADSLDSGDAADAARAAANDADKAADDAETAAKNARADADAATQAAADADAAATRAEAAAKRARSDADAAQADKAKADAAVKTATSAAADAIKASQDAASEARAAVKLADEAEQHAKDAKSQADQANTEAGKALAASAKAAGYAHVTAQAAADAGQAAEQVANPANDAIQLGSRYVDTDAAAGLVVLTGQASKSIADQQQAVADAHAKNAQAEADAAKNLADQAKGDAKEAYQHAANAAQYAADARTYSKQALGYAADAAKAAAAASASLARTIEYDKQAAADAAAAGTAADNADGYAKDARSSADAAALDADAARSAAAQAEQDAKDARAAADRADTAATEAEQAAKDADKYAKEAQDAADKAEHEKANQQVQTGATTGVGGVFSVIDDIKQNGDPEQLPNECHNFNCNTLVYIAHFDAVVSYYLCLNPDVPATASGCPAEDTVFIKTVTIKGLSKKVKMSAWDVTVELWTGIVKSIKGDFTGCYHKITGDGDGSLGDCAWAATWLPLGGPLGKIAEAIRGVDTALRSGEGVADALKALKGLDVDAETLADIERQVDVYEEARTACRVNSFPGTTRVVLADGSHKSLQNVRVGDLLLATDPATGGVRGEPVTRTFHHATVDLVDVGLTDGGHLTSTPGHRFYVTGRGWTLASDLRSGQALRGPDGSARTVAAVLDRHQAAPWTVYDLTVAGLHTFYALAGGSPVLVHNCNDLAADARKFPGLAHTLDEHTAGLVTPQEARELAEAKTAKNGYITANSLFVDEQTAQQVVDYALANNANRIRRWLRGPDSSLEMSGTFGARNSLGKAYYPDGSVKEAGNTYIIKLVRAKGHKAGYYVQTCYPK
ncbi:RICIN domain-containing protein [Streptomyces sp. NPDC007205]|uniref:RICIN domain-containing protein n=1 Tax=Streptomyces sp. NPDC007205 TaxID=3154316 RepID=UPI0033CAB8B2